MRSSTTHWWRGAAAAAGLLVAVLYGAAPVQAAGPADAETILRSLPSTHTQAQPPLSPAEVARRVDAQPRQQALADALLRQLGNRAAGAYLDAPGDTLVVNVLDGDAAATVNAGGARARLVRRDSSQLTAVKAQLDRTGGVPGSSWGIDIPGNTVTVRLPSNLQGPKATAFLRLLQRQGDKIRVERITAKTTTTDAYGGDRMYPLPPPGQFPRNPVCTSGFNARKADGTYVVITAGHCTRLITQWSFGTSEFASFPDDDFGTIRVANPAGMRPQPGVLVYPLFNPTCCDWTIQPINTFGRVPVGSPVCKTGMTTYTTCGTVLGYHQTVVLSNGVVLNGMTATDLCARPGDSGGPLFAGNSAQGITSAATSPNVTCDAANRQSFAWFQPVDEVLVALGLTLL